MSLDVSYCYIIGMTEEERSNSDKQVRKNRKRICLKCRKFLRRGKRLRKNAKRKVKKVILYTMTILHISQPILPAAAVVLPMPNSRPEINVLSPIRQINIESGAAEAPKVAPTAPEKFDTIIYKKIQTEVSEDEFRTLAYRLLAGEIDFSEFNAVLEIRGGSLKEKLSQAVCAALIIWMLGKQMRSLAFQPPPPAHERNLTPVESVQKFLFGEKNRIHIRVKGNRCLMNKSR